MTSGTKRKSFHRENVEINLCVSTEIERASHSECEVLAVGVGRQMMNILWLLIDRVRQCILQPSARAAVVATVALEMASNQGN